MTTPHCSAPPPLRQQGCSLASPGARSYAPESWFSNKKRTSGKANKFLHTWLLQPRCRADNADAVSALFFSHTSAREPCRCTRSISRVATYTCVLFGSRGSHAWVQQRRGLHDSCLAPHDRPCEEQDVRIRTLGFLFRCPRLLLPPRLRVYRQSAHSLKSDTSGAMSKPGDKTTQTSCDDNRVAGALGQGEVVVEEAIAGVAGDVVVDAQRTSVPAAVSETNDDETYAEPEASSAGAAPYCYTGSELSETVKLKGNTFDSETGGFNLTGSGLDSISCLRVSSVGATTCTGSGDPPSAAPSCYMLEI